MEILNKTIKNIFYLIDGKRNLSEISKLSGHTYYVIHAKAKELKNEGLVYFPSESTQRVLFLTKKGARVLILMRMIETELNEKDGDSNNDKDSTRLAFDEQ